MLGVILLSIMTLEISALCKELVYYKKLQISALRRFEGKSKLVRKLVLNTGEKELKNKKIIGKE